MFLPERLSRSAPERVTQLAHYQETTVGTELHVSKFQPQPTIEIHPITPLETRTLWVIHETRPFPPTNTLIYM